MAASTVVAANVMLNATAPPAPVEYVIGPMKLEGGSLYAVAFSGTCTHTYTRMLKLFTLMWTFVGRPRPRSRSH